MRWLKKTPAMRGFFKTPLIFQFAGGANIKFFTLVLKTEKIKRSILHVVCWFCSENAAGDKYEVSICCFEELSFPTRIVQCFKGRLYIQGVFFRKVPPRKVLSVEDDKISTKKWKRAYPIARCEVYTLTLKFLVGNLSSSTLRKNFSGRDHSKKNTLYLARKNC